MKPVERIKMCLGFYFLLTANRNPLVRSWQFDIMIEFRKGRWGAWKIKFYSCLFLRLLIHLAP